VIVVKGSNHHDTITKIMLGLITIAEWRKKKTCMRVFFQRDFFRRDFFKGNI